MALPHFPKTYDAALLDALEKAFSDVLQVLAAHDPDFDCDERVMQMALADKLKRLAEAEIRNRHDLRNRTLQSLSIGAFH